MTLATALRGDTSRFRENTLPAIRSAIAAGADALAVDLCTTSDGHVVVVRERGLEDDRALTRHGRRPALAELAALDTDVEQRVPTFMEVLAEAATGVAHCSLLCEVADVETAVAADAVVGEHGMGERVCYTGTVDTLRAARAKLPHVRMALSWAQPDLPAPDVWEDVRPEVYGTDYRLLTRELVLEIQRHGYAVAAWTVDDFPEMVRVAGMGVDSIVTSNIGELVNLTRYKDPSSDTGPEEIPRPTPERGGGLHSKEN
ncbi:glycerophosphodiester phosphodiesterase [Streptomonospora sp. PA3]|uniref:glycerophosphodiester phosphodiesterase n=1 Tax=Streptomonospora sp. PA3 TaxID=2607326 RepID=UPI0012DDB3EF|nr:glycerophosphodiester phosphodiesterase [Streptomonospora sp. PA3]MUL42854.1 glycerophosphodiester phosphodiesterase [Streptomonospora sp. PA3]